MNIKETMDFIGSYSKSGKPVTDLSRARELMECIGNPEKSLKFVHVAGTNGKGSVVEYISNALIYSGYKTGQFTSPFVLHYTDRIRINGEEVDEASMCDIAEFVCERIADREYSQFEITMAIALLWFQREKCDIVVFEAGIGGLLDCTNVIPPPLVSVITSISLDHTAILGDTVEKIAAQKAGIIKKGSAVVVSPMCDCKDIFEKKAQEVGAEFVITKKSCEKDDLLEYDGILYNPLMFGCGQFSNASVAIETCRYLRKNGFDISERNIKKSVETTMVKARWQYIKGNPPVIVDGGHNPEGILNLETVLGKFTLRKKRNIYTVMGMVDTKNYTAGVSTVARYSAKMFTVNDFAPNAVPAEKLTTIAGAYTDAVSCSSLEEAVKKAKKLALENNGIVVVCGSLYLASKYLSIYENKQNSI